MKKTVFIEKMLPRVTKASRYLGNEINAVQKDLSRVSVTFALAFPDAYEVGMSHLGLHLLYHILNENDDMACERVFAPWPDLEKEMAQETLPLASLESGRPIKNFDVVGFSLEYELCYATVLRMLTLAGIPLLARDRPNTFPLVIAGGPATLNPEPVADFFDALLIGDGEEAIMDIARRVKIAKEKNTGKKPLLDALSEIPGMYIPAFFTPVYGKDHRLQKIIPEKPGYEKIERRIVTRFDCQPFCTSPIVPYMQIIHDRAAIEITRGCSRGCRFCMAGMIYRPVRERKTETILNLAAQALKNTGYEELAFASLSSGDYSDIENLMCRTMDKNHQDRIAVSFPSLRAGTLTDKLIDQIKTVRKTGFTIAPEAGTQRLRDVINKGISEEEIITTAQKIFSAGWQLIKLYFMIGLPTETMADLDGIIALARKVAAVGQKAGKGRIRVNVSISTFVPKPHTPFQWENQDREETILKKQEYLRRGLRAKNIQVKTHDNRLSTLESIFSRGDRQLSAVLIKAHALGAGFEAWTEFFNNDIWTAAFTAAGIEKDHYLRERTTDECLPWSHISARINPDFLRRERENAYREIITPDCRTGPCARCGVCGEDIHAELQPVGPGDPGTNLSKTPDIAPKNRPSFYYTLTFSKTGPARFISHLELTRCFARAVRRAAIPIQYSGGFHPLPRIIFHEALSVGIESLNEFANLELRHNLDPREIRTRLNPCLPPGIEILDMRKIALKKTGLADIIQNKRYLIYLQSQTEVKEKINAFLEQPEIIVPLVTKRKTYHINIKEAVAKITLDENNVMEIITRPTTQKTAKISKILETVLQTDEKEIAGLKILKTGIEKTPLAEMQAWTQS